MTLNFLKYSKRTNAQYLHKSYFDCRFYPGDTLSVQTSTSNETKLSSHSSSDSSKKYKLLNKAQLNASLEGSGVEPDSQIESNEETTSKNNKGDRLVIDNENAVGQTGTTVITCPTSQGNNMEILYNVWNNSV